VYDRKFGCSPIKSFKEWARRAQHLQRRGFGADAIKRVMGSWGSAALDAQSEDHPEPGAST